MRVILAGQRSFGAAVLEALLEDEHEVAAVWATPGDALWGAAHRRGLELSEGKLDRLFDHTHDADLIVAAHSHHFISAKTRAATRLGGIGYHPSLLPRHRGRDAVRWTIHMGDPVAGGSVYWLTDNVDGGPIAAQEHVLVRPDDDASSLWRRELFPLGVGLLRRVLRDLEDGILIEVPQDEACATWEPSWERPPLHRPDLTQIGSGPAGFDVQVTPDALR